MARPHSFSIVVMALVGLLYAVPARAEEVRAAVDAGNRAFVAAFLRGDATAVANLYSEDAQVYGPGSPTASGRKAIAAFWQSTIESGIKDVALRTAEVASTGDLAYETGTVRIVAKDGTATEDRYVVVWKRIGGKWMLHRDIWNSSK